MVGVGTGQEWERMERARKNGKSKKECCEWLTFSLTTFFSFVTSERPEVSVAGSSTVTAVEGDEVTLTCQVMSTPQPVVTWMFNGTNVNISSDRYEVRQTTDGTHSLIINSATIADTGIYTCHVNNTAIPAVVMDEIDLTVDRECCNSWLLCRHCPLCMS